MFWSVNIRMWNGNTVEYDGHFIFPPASRLMWPAVLMVISKFLYPTVAWSVSSKVWNFVFSYTNENQGFLKSHGLLCGSIFIQLGAMCDAAIYRVEQCKLTILASLLVFSLFNQKEWIRGGKPNHWKTAEVHFERGMGWCHSLLPDRWQPVRLDECDHSRVAQTQTNENVWKKHQSIRKQLF